MKFRTTRTAEQLYSFSQATELGLGPDGGLFVPINFPHFDPEDFDSQIPLWELASYILGPFVNEDPYFPGARGFSELCRRTFSFPIQISEWNSRVSLLELFHGPTAAFKDFGARFLAEWFSQISNSDQIRRTVLVATSGDTGGAVAAAFFNQDLMDVIILFPKGMISPFQQTQLTCWGGNVRAYAVDGTFDDCQRLVKEAFSSADIRKHHRLISANSINIARLLPQMVYHAWGSLQQFHKTKKPTHLVIPSGNLGNSVSAIWAKELGFPIGNITMAFNSNRAVPDYFANHKWEPHKTLPTLANAMDVGNPSNMERLLFHLPRAYECPWLSAVSVTDESIREVIQKSQTLVCPHTAVGIHVAENFGSELVLVAATAAPAKFDEVIHSITGRHTPLPANLRDLLNRPTHFESIPAKLAALRLG